MSKKISTIFLSLFLIGILSVSCSNSDKTGAGDGSTTTKGIEQYNNNFYVSTSAVLDSVYLWVSIKDGQVATFPNDNNTTAPDFTGIYFTVTGSGTDYSFSINNLVYDNICFVTKVEFNNDSIVIVIKIIKIKLVFLIFFIFPHFFVIMYIMEVI